MFHFPLHVPRMKNVPLALAFLLLKKGEMEKALKLL